MPSQSILPVTFCPPYLTIYLSEPPTPYSIDCLSKYLTNLSLNICRETYLKGLAAWFFRIDFHLNIRELATDAVDYSISIPLEHVS